MRWLVGLTALISACGLSDHKGGGEPASGAGGSAGEATAPAGSSGSAGASMQTAAPGAGAAGANARAGAEHPGLPTASAGNGSGAAGAAQSGSAGAATNGSAGAGGTPSTATGGTGAGGLSNGGGAPNAAAGTTSTADNGGASSDAHPPGPSGYALHFGVQSFADELIPLFDSRLDGAWGTPHTFEAWFRTTGNVAPLVSAYDDDTWGAVSIGVVNGGVCFHYEVGVNPPFHDICSPTRTLNDGKWHHAAVIVSDSLLRIFEDGVLALDASVDLTLPDFLDRLNLGTGTAGTEGQTVFLDGDLDEVRVWRGARTPTEIANYRATELVPSFTPDSDGNYLLAYLRLDDGTGADMLEDLGAASNRPAELNIHETAEPWITPGAF